MKKLMLMFMSALFVLTLVIGGTAFAAPTAELTALAAYVPDNVTLFAAVRTDHAFFEELDAIITQIASKTRSKPSATDSIVGGLNQAMLFTSDGALNYETGVRSWLGDSAALVFPSTSAIFRGGDVPPLVFLIAVTDRAAAQNFLDTILAEDIASQTVVIEEDAGATLYISAQRSEASYGLTDDIMVVFGSAYSDMGRQLTTTMPNQPLSQAEDFVAAHAALPADDYSAFGYLNLGGIVSTLPEFMPTSAIPIKIDYGMLADSLGVQAFGATVLDSRVLTFDAALVHSDVSVFEAFGLPAPTAITRDAIDPTYARFFQSDVLLYSQSTQTGSQIGALMDDFVNIGDSFLHDMIVPLIQMVGEEEAADFVGGFSFNTITTFVELAIEGTIGLPVDQFFALLDGQSASAFSVVPDPDTYVTFETLQIFENVDAAGSETLIAGLARLLEDFRVDFSYEDGSIVLPSTKPLTQMMLTIDPERVMNTAAPDMVIMSNDELVLMGSRPEITFALAPSDDSLAANDAYVYDSQFFLPGAQSLSFMNLSALYPLFTEDAPLAEVAPQSDRDQINSALSVFNSASMTALTTDDNTQLRFTLTLGK